MDRPGYSIDQQSIVQDQVHTLYNRFLGTMHFTSGTGGQSWLLAGSGDSGVI
jgi:hypothetical protein